LPEYRLLGAADPGVVLADLVSDAHAAFRWAFERCQQLGLAEGRLGAGGGSAGGHLALSLVLMSPAEDQAPAPRPGFLLLCNPVADCSPEGFGGHILGAEWKRFSPLHLLQEQLPPCFIVHGTADTTTPIAGVRAFRDRAAALGGRCELHEYEGRRHAFFNHPPDFDDVVEKMVDFLASLGFAEQGKCCWLCFLMVRDCREKTFFFLRQADHFGDCFPEDGGERVE
jgi:acetyl esterase/lipase